MISLFTALAAAAAPLSAADLFPGYGAAISSASVDVDVSMPQLLISTPNYPANGAYINIPKSGFTWVGVSTVTAANLGGAQYALQVDDNIDFSSPEIALSAPVIVGNTSVFSADGAITISTHTLSDAATYYWRVFTQGSGLSGPYSSTSSFTTDFTAPAASDYKVVSSTGGLLNENQWLPLSGGVTVQITAQDAVSGLAVSTSALWGGGDGYDWGDLTSGFSVKYTTTAGGNWIDGSWSAGVVVGSKISALAVYNGNMYAGDFGNGKVYVSADGVNWSATNSGAAVGNTIRALAVYNGKLYAGDDGNGKVYVSADGVSWNATNGGAAVGGSIYSLAVYNGKLYAGDGGNGKVYMSADGVSWNATNNGAAVGANIYAFAVYNGKLYAGDWGTSKVYASADGVSWSAGADVGNRIYSLAVYNGRLYAGDQNTGKVYASADGVSWSATNGGAAVGSIIVTLAVYDGKLYAGDYNTSKVYVSADGVSWNATNGGKTLGGYNLRALAVYNGKLYAGEYDTGKVYSFSPLTAGLTGSDGTTAAQTLSASGLNFAQSTSTTTCNGVTCGATNQVVFNASDMAGNVRTYGPYAVLVDTTPPSIPVMSAPADGAAYSTTTLSFSWAAGTDTLSGLAGYELQLSTAADFAPLTWSTFTAGVSYGVGNIPEGLTYWRLRSKDNVGNYSVFSATRTFYIDVSNPIITNNQSSPTEWYQADPGAVFNIDFTDLLSGVTTAQYRITSSPAGGGSVLKNWTDIYSNPAGAASYTADWAVDFAALTEGSNFVSVRVFDKAGLWISAADAFVIRKDIGAPVVIINQPGDNTWRGAPGTLYNVDFADAGSGVASVLYMITSQPSGGGTVLKDWDYIAADTSTALYSQDWGIDFSALDEAATNYVSVRAVDLLGKTTTYYDAFYALKDITNPSITDNQSDDVWRYADAGAIYDVDFADSGGSKLNRAQYSISLTPGSGDGGVKGWTDIAVSISSNSYSQNWALDFTAARAGTNYVSVKAYDNAGNYNQANDVFSVRKDTANPVITDNQSGDDVWRSAAGTLYNIDFADALSGLATAQYRVTSQPGQAGAVIKDWSDIYSNAAGTAAYTDDWVVDFAALQEWTVNYVTVRAYDLAGKTAISADVFHVWKDTTPPSVPAMSAPSDGAAYSTGTVSFSWAAGADPRSGLAGYEVQLSTEADFAPLSWSTFTTGVSYGVGSLSEGRKYWRLRSKDNIGNYSVFSATRVFYIDLSSPVITNNQSSPTDWYPDDPGAVFNVDFADALSGITTAQYRVTASPAGGGSVIKDWTDIYSNPAGAASYTADWAVDFAALQGINYVSVRVFDKAGLWVSAADAFVVRKDVGAPVVINNQQGDNTWRNSAGTLYDVDFADAGSGVVSVLYKITSQPLGGGAVVKDWDYIAAATSTALYSQNWGVDFSALDETSPNYVSVRASDLLGKTTTYYDAFYVLKDITKPTMIDNQPDDVWRYADAGAIYDVDFADAGGSKLNRAQYSISLTPGSGDGGVKGWTDIAVSISSNGYNQNWALDFTAARSGSNYVSVKAYDNAGNYHQANDIFSVRKDTTNPVITDNQSGDDIWRGAGGTLYNVDFADALSGLATAQYRVTSQPGQTGAVIKDWTDIYSNAAGTAAYTDDWAVDFAALQERATNYVSVRAFDLAGKTAVSNDVFHVWKDTTPPSAFVQSFSVNIMTLSLLANGLDRQSGLKDYYFEVSPEPDFSDNVSSAGYSVSNLAVFADMLEATTYYARVKTRDNLYNESSYSVALSTLTRGFVAVSSRSLAPVKALQGTDNVMMAVDMVTNPGKQALLRRVDLVRAGTLPAADGTTVKIYRDNNGDDLVDGGDTPLGSAGFFGVNASVTLGVPLIVSDTPSKLLVVYSFSSGATVDTTAGVTITSASKLVFSDPYSAAGVFPMSSSLSTIEDGINKLNITAVSAAPAITQPGTANVPVIKLTMQTDVGTSMIDRLNVKLSGTMASNYVGVKLYRDTNGNAQFDMVGDTLLSSGQDTFVEDSSTITLIGTAANRTVGVVPVYMFVVADVVPDTPEGDNFALGIDTAAAFTLNNTADTPVMTPDPFTSGSVTVQTNNTAVINLQSLAPAEFVQGGLYSVALASAGVGVGIAELNRVKVNKLGTAYDRDIQSVRIYKDQVQDGGGFNYNFDLLLGSAAFSGGVATINITTETIRAGATTQLFVVYEISPTATAGNTLGAGFTNTAYFRMASNNTSVTGNFPFNTAAVPIRATINPLRITAAEDMTTGSVYQGTLNKPILRLVMHSEFNPVSWSALRVKKTGTLADSMITAVKLYHDTNGDTYLTPGTDELLSAGNDVFLDGLVNIPFLEAQSVTAGGGGYFVALDLSADAPRGATVGVEISTTDWLAINEPNYISTASVPAPYTGGPTVVEQYPNIITVSTANIMPSAGAYPGAENVPIFKITLKTDISKADLLAVKFSKSGSLHDDEVKAVKVYYDANNRGSFNAANLDAYALVTSSTITFGTDGQAGIVTLGISEAGREIIKAGRNYFVVVDMAPGAVTGRSMNMRVLDNSGFTVSAPNSVAAVSFSSPLLYVRAPPQTLNIAFESKISTYVVQGQTSVLVASFTVSASSYSIDMSRVDLARGGNGFDSDITLIKLYRDGNISGAGNGIWDGIAEETFIADGVFSGGLVSFSPDAQTIQYPNRYMYYIVADISETAAYGRTFGVDIPAVGYFAVNDPHSVSIAGFPLSGQRAVIQPTLDNLIVVGVNSAPALTQGDSNKVVGRLRVHTDAHSSLISSIRFDKSGTTPDADIYRVRVYKDNGNLALDSGDQLVGSLSSFSSGLGVMVMNPAQSVGTADTDYLVAVDISTLAVVNTSFTLRVTPAVVAPDSVSITGSTITFTIAGVIADKSDTIYMNFSDIASQSLYLGVDDAPLIKFSFWTDNDTAYLTGLKLNFTGTALQSDMPSIKIYRDTNGNGYFDPDYDVLAATAAVEYGEAYLYLPGAGDEVTVSTRAYFVAVDIADTAIIGNTVSAGLANENNIYSAGVDRAAPFPGMVTGLSTIRDPRIPTPPVIAIYRADDRAYADTDEVFNAYRTLLKFRWSSMTHQGSVGQSYYYIGSQPATESTPAGSWTAGGVTGEVSVRGLNLLNNGIYYLSVRVKNSEGAYYSDIVYKRVIVDTVVPAMSAGTVNTTTEGSDLILNWPVADVGCSGLDYYVVEERKGNSPLWVAVSTTSDLFLSITGGGARPSDISRNPGAYYFRVYPVNNAGISGAASDPLAVNIGLEQLDTISDASAYPNPFDSRKKKTTIAFTLNTNSDISITIYNAFGRKVKSLNSTGTAGANSAVWDGADSSGAKVSMGMYICVIKAGGKVKIIKVGVKH